MAGMSGKRRKARRSKPRPLKGKQGVALEPRKDGGAPEQVDGLAPSEAAGAEALGAGEPALRAVSPAPGGIDDLGPPRRRGTGPLERKPDAAQDEARDVSSPFGPSPGGTAAPEPREDSPLSWQADDLEQHHRRKTGPLGAALEASQPDSTEIEPIFPEGAALEQPRRRKTGPLEAEPVEALPELRESEPVSPEGAALEQPRRRKTGPLEAKPVEALPELRESEPVSPEGAASEQPRRRETGPLEAMPEDERPESGESEPISPEGAAPEQPRRRKTGPLKAKPAEALPELRESEPISPGDDILDHSRRRDTGPLEKNAGVGQVEPYEIDSTTAPKPSPADESPAAALDGGGGDEIR